jgi:hypothetical protein
VRLVQFFTAWANAPFTIAFGIAAGVAILQATGALSLLGDHDADVDGDVDADIDGDVDGEAEVDGDTDGEHSFLDLLGVGRIPFSLAWQTGAIAFAMVGLLLNARYIGGSPPLITLLWTIPTGIVASLGSIAGAARLLGPLFTPEEATSREALVGREGVVISSKVTPEFGEVRIRDDHGHDVRVICRLAPGEDSVSEGKHVIVVDIEAGGRPVVAPV